MVSISPEGHNWGPLVFDDLAKILLVVISLWTAFMASNLYGVIYNRKLPFIRMRKVLLLCGAVICLHVYLVMVFLVYMLNGTFSCRAEYWIMSVYLPIGVALFQLQNMVLFSQSLLQEELVWSEHEHTAARARALRNKKGFAYLIERFKQLTAYEKTKKGVVVGLAVQVTIFWGDIAIFFIVSIVIYIVSPKFHGLTSHSVSAKECRRGWEWAPTIVWQLLWSWVFGPFVYVKIRRIRDVHYWRLQTSLTILASLPGAPLWLMAVYSDKLDSVSKYWVAPMWFALGIMAMEFVTVFFPLLEVYQRRQYLRARDAANQRNAHGVPALVSDPATRMDSTIATTTGASRRNNDMYSMDALNNALTTNIAPLLDFAATKDFSAENILFLRDVAKFKDSWTTTDAREGTITADSRHMLFTEAVKIYEEYVCPRLSRAPINISGPMRVAMEKIFEAASSQRLQSHVSEDVVTPFATEESSNAFPLTTFSQPSNRHGLRSESQEQIIDPIVPATTNEPLTSQAHNVEIPNTFGREVFDRAEQNIKYTVLTNTWSRYLEKCETTSMASSDGANTLSSSKSVLTTVTWIKA